MSLNIPTSSIAIPSNIYPNWDFWLENIPSGNPGALAKEVRKDESEKVEKGGHKCQSN
jgi:hypothetical protein